MWAGGRLVLDHQHLRGSSVPHTFCDSLRLEQQPCAQTTGKSPKSVLWSRVGLGFHIPNAPPEGQPLDTMVSVNPIKTQQSVVGRPSCPLPGLVRKYRQAERTTPGAGMQGVSGTSSRPESFQTRVRMALFAALGTPGSDDVVYKS